MATRFFVLLPSAICGHDQRRILFDVVGGHADDPLMAQYADKGYAMDVRNSCAAKAKDMSVV